MRKRFQPRPKNLAFFVWLQHLSRKRDKIMLLHKKGARDPDALNPDNWAIDAYAFSIAANRAFMSRLFMNLTTNIQHYPEWTAFLKDRQPKALILWGETTPSSRWRPRRP
jgi:hypothetical protein